MLEVSEDHMGLEGEPLPTAYSLYGTGEASRLS